MVLIIDVYFKKIYVKCNGLILASFVMFCNSVQRFLLLHLLQLLQRRLYYA